MWKFIPKFVFLHRKEFVVTTVSLLILVTALLFSSQLISFLSAISIKKEGVKIETAIQQELNTVSRQREEIISSKTLNNALEKKDLLQLLTIAQAEAKKREVSFIVVTDVDGFVLTRSHLPTQRGDNLFQTTAHGRIIAMGETVTAAIHGARSPLIFVSASPISDGNLPIGGITVGYALNNSYATRFKEKYLKQGVQIVFYTPQEGIVGDSFNDKDKTQLFSAYFSLGSDLIAQNLAGLSKEIKINGSYYTIRHIIFPGIKESPGGVFIFFPIRHNSYSLFLAGSITLLFFVFYYLTFFLLKFLDHHKHRIPIFLLLGFILFIAIYFITLIKLDHSAIELNKSPYLIYNSIMKFEPESDVISQFSEKTIAIKVFPGGEAINAVNATIKYDPQTVEVLDIITTNSFCDPSFFLEKEIDKEKGEVRITCGIPNPGFSDAIGTVAELLVQPLGLQAISLEFSEETQVLANDGLGTNVLRTVTGGYYQVIGQEFATANIQNPFPIFSSSHPNSNRWYKNKNIRLSWSELSGGNYYYALNHVPTIDAKDKTLSIANNYLDISVSEDGIYYFHLQAQDAKGKRGPISSFKIMVDASPPSLPKIKASSEMIKKGDIVRLDFTSEDALSGLQSGFYVKINEGILLPVKPPFYIPFQESGEYPIVIRVFDKANNFSDSSVVIHVSD
ncbi:MAG: hypothetical protein Q7K16_03500 [Candidatus Azambacteria bacterium]|nr:hypothetical protein [Candidatus Azambacteria bacterium]